MKKLLVVSIVLLALSISSVAHEDSSCSSKFIKNFTASCMAGPAQRRCLSLSMLTGEILTGPSKDAMVLGGISILEGIMINEEKDDVLLVGQYRPEYEPMYLDDFRLMLKNVYVDQEYIHCSLDPNSKNIARMNVFLAQNRIPVDDSGKLGRYVREMQSILGPQCVRIGGVPDNSRIANTMIYADYHMKQISQSLVQLENIRSTIDIQLDRIEADCRAGLPLNKFIRQNTACMSRFWFHVLEDSPTFSISDGIVWLDECKVGIMTEQQKLTADDELVDIKSKNLNAEIFAQEFSARLDSVADQVVYYRDLINLYRLYASVLAMKHNDYFHQANMSPNTIIGRCWQNFIFEIPDSLDALANAKTLKYQSGNAIYWFCSIACGGVSMEIELSEDAFVYSPALVHRKNAYMRRIPEVRKLWWPIENL